MGRAASPPPREEDEAKMMEAKIITQEVWLRLSSDLLVVCALV